MTNARTLVKDSGDIENNTNLTGRTKTFGVYAVDTFSFDDFWHLTSGLRYNYQEVDNVDKRAGSNGWFAYWKAGPELILLLV